MDKVFSVCAYCGTGCGLYLQVEGNQVISIEPVEDHPISKGELCIKGYYGFNHLQDPRRLNKPLMKKENGFVPVSWDQALDFVVERLQRIKKESGPDAFAMLASARATNEENYLAQKFARAVMGTNNIDHCARL